MTATPTFTLSLTPTETTSATPVWTQTPIVTDTPEAGLSHGQGVVLAPMPVKKGGKVCLYTDQRPSASKWDIFNMTGVSLGHLTFGNVGEACWDTSGAAPGVYNVRLNIISPDGRESTIWKKVLVQP
jgi:hypothetical protein